MKKLLCTILAACCLFFAACGASSAALPDGCTVTAIKNGKTVALSEETAGKLVALAEKAVDSELRLNLALTIEEAEDCKNNENGAYVFIEYPEEIVLDSESEYPVEVKSMEILIRAEDDAVILIPNGGVFYAGAKNGSFARKVKSHLE